MKKGSFGWFAAHSMKPDDSYGSTHREELKKSMEKPWTPHNRRQKPHKDPIDVTTWVLGWLIGALILGVVLSQVAIRCGWRP